MKKLSILLNFLLLGFLCSCEEGGVDPNVLQKPYQTAFGTGLRDEASSVTQTSDAGYIITGVVSSVNTNSGIFLVKLSKERTIQWANTYGGAVNESANSMQVASDGGYIVAGSSESGAGDQDFYIMKTSSAGNIEWANLYGGDQTETANSIKRTVDGGYIACGYTNSFGAGGADIWIVKINSGGAVEWSRAYGGTGNDIGTDVIQSLDGGYLIAGETRSFNVQNKDGYFIKINSAGDIEWSGAYGGPANDELNSVSQSLDGGYIAAGVTISFGAGSQDIFAIKVSSSGIVSWSKTYGGGFVENVPKLYSLTDGSYIIGGTTTSFGGGGSDVYLLKLFNDGTINWSKAYGGPSNEDLAGAFTPTLDGGFLSAARTLSYGAGQFDMYLVKADKDGTTCGSSINAGTIVNTPAFNIGAPITVATITSAIGSGSLPLQNTYPLVENLICR